MLLTVKDPNFVAYFFRQLSVDGTGLPSGDKKLRIEIYEGDQTNKKENELVDVTYKISTPKDSRSTYTIEYPKLRLSEKTDPTVLHLWGFCTYEGQLIAQKHWTINPDDMGITAA